MGDYLRDSFIPFLTIKSDDLVTLNSDLQETVKKANLNAPNGDLASLNYILRYDGMGIVRTNFGEIKKCFDVGKNRNTSLSLRS